MNYRALSKIEIKELEKNGCFSSDWNNVKVKDGFVADNICNTSFNGVIELGVFSDIVKLQGGVNKKSGIRNAYLNNCTIGDNVLIENIGDFISNCNIGDNCKITNCGSIYCEENSFFGHDVKAKVMIETGGRELQFLIVVAVTNT